MGAMSDRSIICEADNQLQGLHYTTATVTATATAVATTATQGTATVATPTTAEMYCEETCYIQL